MARTPPPDSKVASLKAAGALHPRPKAVQDEAFSQHEFFDPRDLVQVRYEMLRRHRIEAKPVAQVARAFGTSRQAFYAKLAQFQVHGLPGLVPKRRGPRHAHKCSEELLDFVEQWRADYPEGGEPDLEQALRERFGITVHPRSIDRALARRKKKRQRSAPLS